jgi:tetratricopeptide (TPR) repeat protein
MKRYATLVLVFSLSGIVYSNEFAHESVEINQKEMETLLEGGFHNIQTGNSSIAISKYLNPVIEKYESQNYGKKVYCARTQSETLLYLMQAANDNNDAIAIEPIWAQAYFLKGYASLDLGRKDEARKWLNKALELSPANSGYNSELAHLYQLEMKWKESADLYKKSRRVCKYHITGVCKKY